MILPVFLPIPETKKLAGCFRSLSMFFFFFEDVSLNYVCFLFPGSSKRCYMAYKLGSDRHKYQ